TGGLHSEFDANVSTTEGRASLSTRSLITTGTVGEGLWSSLYFKGNLDLPIPNRLVLNQIPEILGSGALAGRGEGILLGNLSAGSFNLATLRGNVSLAD